MFFLHLLYISFSYFTPQREYLLSSSADCSVSLYKYNPTSESNSVNALWEKIVSLSQLHDRPIYSVDWSAPTEEFPVGLIGTAGGSDDIILLAPTCENAIITGLTNVGTVKAAHENDINCITFNPKHPSVFVTASDDSKISLWSIYVDKQ